ncbi:hypothetical protein K1719_026145 [Acacia pycnantha]|nr:hypothetical protein K1719_026145 [Acacia pycnantha]
MLPEFQSSPNSRILLNFRSLAGHHRLLIADGYLSFCPPSDRLLLLATNFAYELATPAGWCLKHLVLPV